MSGKPVKLGFLGWKLYFAISFFFVVASVIAGVDTRQIVFAAAGIPVAITLNGAALLTAITGNYAQSLCIMLYGEVWY